MPGRGRPGSPGVTFQTRPLVVLKTGLRGRRKSGEIPNLPQPRASAQSRAQVFPSERLTLCSLAGDAGRRPSRCRGGTSGRPFPCPSREMTANPSCPGGFAGRQRPCAGDGRPLGSRRARRGELGGPVVAGQEWVLLVRAWAAGGPGPPWVPAGLRAGLPAPRPPRKLGDWPAVTESGGGEDMEPHFCCLRSAKAVPA